MKIFGIPIPGVRISVRPVKIREIKDVDTLRTVNAEMYRDSKKMDFLEWKKKWAGVVIDPSLLGELNKMLKQQGFDTETLEKRMSERE